MSRKTDSSQIDRQAFGIRILRPTHPELRSLRARHNPNYQGHRLWNATWLLMSFLETHGLTHGSRVIEAGCGWGLSGIYCARVHNALVTATDLDEKVFPFLELHARHNEVSIDHTTADFTGIDHSMLTHQDLLIGADICFRPTMIDPLFDLVERALAAGVKRILLSDPGRPTFQTLAARCVESLGGVEHPWQVEEPLISWEGSPVIIRGHLLTIGPWA